MLEIRLLWKSFLPYFSQGYSNPNSFYLLRIVHFNQRYYLIFIIVQYRYQLSFKLKSFLGVWTHVWSRRRCRYRNTVGNLLERYINRHLWNVLNNCWPLWRGMRHTSTALYFYRASKNNAQKPTANFWINLLKRKYVLTNCLQLLYLRFLSYTYLNF